MCHVELIVGVKRRSAGRDEWVACMGSWPREWPWATFPRIHDGLNSVKKAGCLIFFWVFSTSCSSRCRTECHAVCACLVETLQYCSCILALSRPLLVFEIIIIVNNNSTCYIYTIMQAQPFRHLSSLYHVSAWKTMTEDVCGGESEFTCTTHVT